MTPTQMSSLLTFLLLVLVSSYVVAVPELAQQQFLAPAASTGLPVKLSGSTYKPALAGSELHVSNSPCSCRLSSRCLRYLNEGFDSNPFAAYLPSIGTLSATMIFVDFDDARASEDTMELYQHFMPAASEWYRNSSFGRLNLEIFAETSRFYRMPRPSSAYGFNRSMGSENHRRYIQDVLDVVGNSVSLAGTGLLYIVPTREASEISYSPTFMAPIEATNGNKINKTVTFGQDMYEFGFKVMNHETGHTMGLPDTYSYEPRTPATIFVGGYDLMAQIGGVSPDYLAWHKWRLGWIDDDQVVCLCPNMMSSRVDTYTLTPIEEATGLKALVFRHNSTFAIVAETRSGTGLNSDICGTGVLIYTVHTVVPTGRGPVRVQNSSPKSKGCAGGKLNDALFVPRPRKRSTFSGFGITITVIEEIDKGFVIEVHGD